MLLRVADRAHLERDFVELTRILQRLRECTTSLVEENCAAYYEALLTLRQGDRSRAAEGFGKVLDHAPAHYVTRSLLSLGCIEAYAGHLDRALYLCREAKRIPSLCTDHARFYLLRDEAALHSFNGNHRMSLRLLKEMGPAITAIGRTQPAFSFDYYNSLATELEHAGETNAARHFARIAVSSRFAPRFPEWAETARGIHLRMRSATRSAILTLGLPDATVCQPPAKILPFITPQRPGLDQRRVGMIAKIIDDLTELVSDPKASEPLLKLIDRLIVEGATDEQVDRMTRQLKRKPQTEKKG